MDAARKAADGNVGDDLLERLAARVGGRAGVDAVFGPPIERGDVTVIPVARIRWGFGGGGGASEAEQASGSGGGGGVAADPIGYIEVGRAGAEFRPIGRPYLSPGFLLAAAVAGSIMLRAVARLRR
jgi:uncharacterized spore protein YtfJ